MQMWSPVTILPSWAGQALFNGLQAGERGVCAGGAWILGGILGGIGAKVADGAVEGDDIANGIVRQHRSAI